jgi:hypothetical protein
MTERQDLYTDYAIQIFSSYLIEDIASMQMVLESFKNEGKESDEIFLPGLIYGLLYHLGSFIRLVSEASDVPVERILSDYAMDYAIAREHLLDNPLLNVSKAKGVLDKILLELKEIEDLFNEKPSDN